MRRRQLLTGLTVTDTAARKDASLPLDPCPRRNAQNRAMPTVSIAAQLRPAPPQSGNREYGDFQCNRLADALPSPILFYGEPRPNRRLFHKDRTDEAGDRAI